MVLVSPKMTQASDSGKPEETAVPPRWFACIDSKEAVLTQMCFAYTVAHFSVTQSLGVVLGINSDLNLPVVRLTIFIPIYHFHTNPISALFTDASFFNLQLHSISSGTLSQPRLSSLITAK